MQDRADIYPLLYRILSAEIWGKDFSLSDEERHLLPALFQEARKQAVIGLVAGAFIRRNIPMTPQATARLLMWTQTVRRGNIRLNEAVVRLASWFKEARIPLVIVKGQTLAQIYPDPLLRQSGDIDFFCGTGRFGDARDLLARTTGLKFLESVPVKHEEFEYEGVIYELHRILSIFPCKRHQKAFNRQMDEAMTRTGEIKINDTGIPVIGPTDNILFQTAHVYHHVFREGIGLRQLCDLALTLARYREETDTDRLRRQLEAVELLRPFRALCQVLTDTLQLPAALLPFPLTDQDRKWGKRIREDIERLTYFGRNQVEQDEKKSRRGIILRNCRRYFALTPRHVLYIPLEMMTRGE